MDNALDLAALGIAAEGVQIGADPKLDDPAVGILHNLLAADHVGIAQTHLAARDQALEAFGRDLLEVGPIDIDFASERYGTQTQCLVLGMIARLDRLRSVLRIVCDDDLQWTQHGHPTRRGRIQVFTDGALEQGHLDQVVRLGDPDPLAEVADRTRRVATAAQAGHCRHARIVPAVDMVLADQLGQAPLAHHRIFEVQPAELDLTRLAGHRDVVHAPVVKRAMVLELERAERVRDAFERIGDGMGVVVGRIETPGGAGLMMDDTVLDAIEHRVSQVDVRRGHVDARAQGAGAVRELAGAHPFEEVEILLDRAIAIGAVPARLGQGPAVAAGLLGVQVADVGQSLLDQLDGERVELLEIVGCEIDPIAPVESEPTHVGLDGVDELDVLLVRIGVVEAQIAGAPERPRKTEVQDDRLGVPDMQITVRLRREARDDARVLAGSQIGLDDLADKIGAWRLDGVAHDALAAIGGWAVRSPKRPQAPHSSACRPD